MKFNWRFINLSRLKKVIEGHFSGDCFKVRLWAQFESEAVACWECEGVVSRTHVVCSQTE